MPRTKSPPCSVAKGVRLRPGQLELIEGVLERRESLSEFLRTAGVREARRRLASRAEGDEHGRIPR